MPSRNVTKIDIADSFYHVYARGHSHREIFLDTEDYGTFLNLFKRYLSRKPQHNHLGVPYPHLVDQVELLCFCLMPNHFHLLLYQQPAGSMTALMRGVMTSYSRYFNKKYRCSGALFESRYKAALIMDQSYLEHISRYIHLNPENWQTFPYSSIEYYLGKRRAEWLRPNRILELFKDVAEYRQFVGDYEDHKKSLDAINRDLADATIP
jgi:putative transposase